jgi:hypothetical protein
MDWNTMLWTVLIGAAFAWSLEQSAFLWEAWGSMPVNTGKVTGRREVAYESLDDILMDAERLVANPQTKCSAIGRSGRCWPVWRLGLHMSIDGPDHRPHGSSGSWTAAQAAGSEKMSAGFQLPNRLRTRSFPPNQWHLGKGSTNYKKRSSDSAPTPAAGPTTSLEN